MDIMKIPNMNAKTKIIIKIGIVGILLVSGLAIWNFVLAKGNVVAKTYKKEYGREENISLTVTNRLMRTILISSCPTCEGFVEIEKKNEQDNWEELPILFPMAACTGPLTLKSGESHAYPVLFNAREIRLSVLPIFDETTKKYVIYDHNTGETIKSEEEPIIPEIGDIGTYKIKFGYLFSLPYSRDKTCWVYSNEFIIKEK